MGDRPALTETSLTERCVLHALLELSRRDQTPANALELLGRCRDREWPDGVVVSGRLSEADLVAGCRDLVERGIVEERDPDATSPAGKGRPSYALAVDLEAVAEVLRDDDRFALDPDPADAG